MDHNCITLIVIHNVAIFHKDPKVYSLISWSNMQANTNNRLFINIPLHIKKNATK